MNWLMKLCSDRGLNLEKLSKKTKVPDQTLRKIAKTGGCRILTLIKLKQAFGVSWSEIGTLIEKEKSK